MSGGFGCSMAGGVGFVAVVCLFIWLCVVVCCMVWYVLCGVCCLLFVC